MYTNLASCQGQPAPKKHVGDRETGDGGAHTGELFSCVQSITRAGYGSSVRDLRRSISLGDAPRKSRPLLPLVPGLGLMQNSWQARNTKPRFASTN